MNLFGGKKAKALLMSLWMSVSVLVPTADAMAQTFSTATRAVGTGASILGGIVKTDYHPENMYIPGYWSNGTGAGGTSGGATEANQGNVGETGGTVSAQQTFTQTAGGSVLKAVGDTQLTYGKASSITSYGGAESGPSTTDILSSATTIYSAGSFLATTGSAMAAGATAELAVGVAMGETLIGGAAMGAGGALTGTAVGAGIAEGMGAVAAACPYCAVVVAVVMVVYAIFDMFGGGIEYSWSGSCAARTGAPCNGWYESNGYTHIGYGLYVPQTALSKIQNDVSMQALGDGMASVMSDKNSDPNAIFDSAGRKIKGNYGLYLGQGNGLLVGYHPMKDSVLMTDTQQNMPNGWTSETVFQGVDSVPLYMYTYAPQVAWNGTN